MIGIDHQNSISTNSTNKCQSNKKQLKVQIISEQNSVKKVRENYIFFRISTWRSFRSYSCLIFFFSASTNWSFSILNSYTKKQKKKKKKRRVTLPRGSNFNAMQWSLIEKREWLEKWRYLFSRERDLAGFFFSFLTDKSHHLVDLLRDITVVHFRRSSTGKQVRQWPNQVDMFQFQQQSNSLLLLGPAKLLLNMRK